MPGTPTPREVVRTLLEGIASGARPRLADLYASDAVVDLPFAGPGGLRLRGRDQLREHFVRAAQSPIRLVPERVELYETDDPEVVVAAYDYLAEAGGRSAVVANAQIVRVRGGLIVESRDFHDHAALARLASDG